MRIFINVLLLTVFSGIFFSLNAQNQKQRNEIIDELNAVKFGKGRITVFEDKAIKHILGQSMAPPRTVYTSDDGTRQYVKMRGFKIQVFSGNNQRTSKNEAYHKQQLVKGSFPGQETVVTFESPFWRLRVGNFRTREDASALLEEMRRAFPAFGKEMYVVVDEVKISVD